MSRLRRLSNASPAQIWRLISRPHMLEVRLRGPRVSTDAAALKNLFPELSDEGIHAMRLEFLRNRRFQSELEERMVEARERRVSWAPWSEFLYLLVRFQGPQLFVETGVFDGQSTAIILQALADNGTGRLVSIDFPAVEPVDGSTHRMTEPTLPTGRTPGWIVPDRLRSRHELHLGDSRELLPKLLESYGPIDAFFHDSMHTYEHMSFEYSEAWAHLRDAGLLLSDDIGWNRAFYQFCKDQGRSYQQVRGGFGATRK